MHLAKTAPAGEPPANTAFVAAAAVAAVAVEAEAGAGEEEQRAAGSGRRRLRQRRGEAEEQQEEAAMDAEAAEAACPTSPGLLVTLLPHPVVQTAPDAGGMAEPEAAGAGGSGRPARSTKQPARFAAGSGRLAGLKRGAVSPIAAPAAPAGTRKQQHQQQQQQEAKRQRTTPLAAAAAPPAEEVTPPPAAAAMLDSEDQTISEVGGCVGCGGRRLSNLHGRPHTMHPAVTLQDMTDCLPCLPA